MVDALDIAVVIPTVNRPVLLQAAIESVLAQTRPARQVIVVDNGENARTRDVADRFAGAVTYLRQPPLGVQAARNAGVRAARTDWVALLDDDDLYRPDFLASCEAAMADDRVSVIGADHRKFRDDRFERTSNFDNAPTGYWDGLRPAEAEAWTFVDHFPVDRLTRFIAFYPSATVVRRALYDEVGGYDPALRGVVAEDIEMLIRLLRAGRLAIVWSPLVSYRMHDSNDSGHDRRGLNQQALGRWQVFSFACDKLRASDPELAARIGERLPVLRAKAFDAAFGLRRFDLATELAQGLRPTDWTGKRLLKRLVSLPASAISRRANAR